MISRPPVRINRWRLFTEGVSERSPSPGCLKMMSWCRYREKRHHWKSKSRSCKRGGLSWTRERRSWLLKMVGKLSERKMTLVKRGEWSRTPRSSLARRYESLRIRRRRIWTWNDRVPLKAHCQKRWRLRTTEIKRQGNLWRWSKSIEKSRNHEKNERLKFLRPMSQLSRIINQRRKFIKNLSPNDLQTAQPCMSMLVQLQTQMWNLKKRSVLEKPMTKRDDRGKRMMKSHLTNTPRLETIETKFGEALH